ncbi:TM2 domain-containing protein [Thiothrix nivea]|nr:TM2 domain-containing protein [Thiothrix nivea]
MQKVLIKSSKLIVPVVAVSSNGNIKAQTPQGERWFKAPDVSYDLAGGTPMEDTLTPSRNSSHIKDVNTPSTENKNEGFSDAKLLLLYESRKKSGIVAALLNLFLPGAGYIYSGQWITGVVTFFFVIALIIFSLGVLIIPVALALIADGFLSASRYNKKLIGNMLAGG